jgi:hypothetical protein
MVRWLVWGLPARLLRRVIDPAAWTVHVFELQGWKDGLRRERRLLRETARGEGVAVARADEIVAALVDGSLTVP